MMYKSQELRQVGKKPLKFPLLTKNGQLGMEDPKREVLSEKQRGFILG